MFFLRVVTYESLPAQPQSFKKTLYNHFEKSPGEYMVSGRCWTFQFWSGEEMLVKNWVLIFHLQWYADFVSASLFNQIIMFTVT